MPATKEPRTARQAQQREQEAQRQLIARAQGEWPVQAGIQRWTRFNAFDGRGFKFKWPLVRAQLPGMLARPFAFLQNRMRQPLRQRRTLVVGRGNVRDATAALAAQPEPISGACAFDNPIFIRCIHCRHAQTIKCYGMMRS